MQAALKWYPENFEVRLLLGQVYLAQGSYQESLSQLARATDVLPGEFEPVLGTALAQLGLDGFLAAPVPPGLASAALEEYLDADVVQERQVSATTLKLLQHTLGRAPDAESAWLLRRFMARIHLAEGHKYRDSGALAQALTAFQTSVRLDPSVFRTKEVFPSRYEYDAKFKVTQRVDANGDTTRYAYNALEQLQRISYPDGSQVGFEYNAASRLFRMTDATGATIYLYDGLGRPAGIEFPNNMVLRYERDAAGRVREIHYPDGQQVSYEYDEAGGLSQVSDATGSITYAYNEAGDLVEKILPNGVGTRYGYDAAGRIITVEHQRNGELLLAYRYRLDGAGRKIWQSRVAPVDTLVSEYVYSPSGRLLEERRSNGQRVGYVYDTAGKRLQRTNSGDTTDYVYGRENRLCLAGEIFFEYDRNGNLVARVSPAGVTEYGYDFENRLVEVERAGQKVRFRYRGDGARWARVVGGRPTYFLADARGEVLVHGNAEGWSTAAFTVGRERLGERGLFYLYDRPGGNVVGLCDSEGVLQARFDYSLFGEILEHTGPVLGFYGFRGGRTELDMDLVYLQGRYYDPALGRFLTLVRSGRPERLNYHYDALGHMVEISSLPPDGR